MKKLWVVLPIIGATVMPHGAASACSTVELRYSKGYTYRPERIGDFVDSAQVIVRAVASSLDSSGGLPIVTFTAVEWIRGGLEVGTLRAAGIFVNRDDFNSRPVPYTMVRGAGQHGSCYAEEYRRGAEYLLMLRPTSNSLLTPYWVPLAPLNEQVRGVDDPWVTWVRTRALASGSRPRVGGEPAGCYRATPALTYSATGAPERDDSAWAIVRLFPDGKARRPLLTPWEDGRSAWTFKNDTLHLRLFDGLVGWTTTLTTTATGWRGTAEYLTDVIVAGRPPFRRSIVLERQPCLGAG